MERSTMVALLVLVLSSMAIAQNNSEKADPFNKNEEGAIKAAQSGGTAVDKYSLNENKALIKRLFKEEINYKNMGVMEGMVSSDYISHNDSVGPPSDIQQTKKFLAAAFAAFPDMRVTIEDMVAEGDKVVVRNTWRGTFRGPWMGMAPTGNEVTWTGIVIWRITNGKITERWANINFAEVMQKIASAQSPVKK